MSEDKYDTNNEKVMIRDKDNTYKEIAGEYKYNTYDEAVTAVQEDINNLKFVSPDIEGHRDMMKSFVKKDGLAVFIDSPRCYYIDDIDMLFLASRSAIKDKKEEQFNYLAQIYLSDTMRHKLDSLNEICTMFSNKTITLQDMPAKCFENDEFCAELINIARKRLLDIVQEKTQELNGEDEIDPKVVSLVEKRLADLQTKINAKREAIKNRVTNKIIESINQERF